MMEATVVVGAGELFQKIQRLAPAGCSIAHLECAPGFASRLAEHRPALVLLEYGEGALQREVNEFLDRSDAGEAFIYLLAPYYDLAQAERMLMGRRRVVRYAALDMVDDPRMQEEIQRFLAEAQARSQMTAEGERKPVGWILKVKDEDYEEQRVVSLFIGEMGEFILKLRAIVADLRKEWKHFSFPQPFKQVSVVKQLDNWHRWEVLKEEPRDKEAKQQQQDFLQHRSDYRLFPKTSPRGFKPPTILLRGETGTGKSLMVRLIHKWTFGDGSKPLETVTDRYPLQELNCIGIPDSLLESELFGAMAGAYTDRTTTTPGKIIPAYGGTLFLDEIGDMPVALQGKLLKFLDDSRVSPVSWVDEGIFVPLTIVAATNADLEARIRKKEFREDLYYRLRGHELTIPPLKDRLWDLERMVDFILQNPRTNRDASGRRYINYVHEQALAKLKGYDFKGNFRDLESILKEAILLARLEGVETLMDRHIVLRSSAEAIAAVLSPALADDLPEPA